MIETAENWQNELSRLITEAMSDFITQERVMVGRDLDDNPLLSNTQARGFMAFMKQKKGCYPILLLEADPERRDKYNSYGEEEYVYGPKYFIANAKGIVRIY